LGATTPATPAAAAGNQRRTQQRPGQPAEVHAKILNEVFHIQ
jgi:hypothetical protein